MSDPVHDLALDVGDLVRTQREMLLQIERLLAIAAEHLVAKKKEELPSDHDLWIADQDPEDWGGGRHWSWRAFGFYFGYPDCGVDAFVEEGGNSAGRGVYRDEDGMTGHAMCDECEADRERARRLAELARRRRIAPVKEECPF